MQEKYEFGLYSYWVFLTNCLILSFSIVGGLVLLMTIWSFVLWQWYGKSMEASGITVTSTMFCVMALFVGVGLIIRAKIKSGDIKCKTREILLRDDCFVYKDGNQKEYTVYWNEVKRIKLIAIKMGYRATIYTPGIKFSCLSYELDPLPLNFKEQLKLKIKDNSKFFEVIRMFRGKSMNAEFKKGFIVRHTKLPIDE